MIGGIDTYKYMYQSPTKTAEVPTSSNDKSLTTAFGSDILSLGILLQVKVESTLDLHCILEESRFTVDVDVANRDVCDSVCIKPH